MWNLKAKEDLKLMDPGKEDSCRSIIVQLAAVLFHFTLPQHCPTGRSDVHPFFIQGLCPFLHLRLLVKASFSIDSSIDYVTCRGH
jgi:hypothetical protein